jgi:hypothetical protein
VAPWLGSQTVEYRTRIRRLDEAWSPPGKGRELMLAGLSAGRWDVEVAARLAGGGEGAWTDPAVARFQVEPTFWQTGWAKLLAILAGCGSAAVAARFLTRHAVHRSAVLGAVPGRTGLGRADADL